MTRINITIKPHEYSDLLLKNALGEEPRILKNVLDRLEKGQSFDDIPKEFTFGKGHVKFFFDKCQYIFIRYIRHRREYVNRFNVQYSEEHMSMVTERYKKIRELAPELCNFYDEKNRDRDLMLERLKDRITNKYKKHTYYGKPIDWNNVIPEFKSV